MAVGYNGLNIKDISLITIVVSLAGKDNAEKILCRKTLHSKGVGDAGIPRFTVSYYLTVGLIVSRLGIG